MKNNGAAVLIIAFVVGQLPTACFAADLLGLYAGGAIGQGDNRFQQLPDGSLLGFDEHHLGWKAMIGVRPISVIGAEVEYIDFGHPHATSTSNFASADVHIKGVALFGVGYLPLPVPLLDIYGKAGLARLQTSANAEPNVLLGLACSPSHPTFHTCGFAQDQSNARFGWGIGAQAKLPFAPLRIRAEFERFNSNTGDPNMLSAGVTWNF